MNEKLRSPQNRVSPGAVSDYELQRIIRDMQGDFRSLERRIASLEAKVKKLAG